MIKNNKPARAWFAPLEDWREVRYALQKQGYSASWDFVGILFRNIKAHAFCNTHKPLENATKKFQ